MRRFPALGALAALRGAALCGGVVTVVQSCWGVSDLEIIVGLCCAGVVLGANSVVMPSGKCAEGQAGGGGVYKFSCCMMMSHWEQIVAGVSHCLHLRQQCKTESVLALHMTCRKTKQRACWSFCARHLYSHYSANVRPLSGVQHVRPSTKKKGNSAASRGGRAALLCLR